MGHRFGGAAWTLLSSDPDGFISGIHGRAEDDVYFLGRAGGFPAFFHYNGVDWMEERLSVLSTVGISNVSQMWMTEDDVYVAVKESEIFVLPYTEFSRHEAVVLRHCNQWSMR